jgi:hypothetical protein
VWSGAGEEATDLPSQVCQTLVVCVCVCARAHACVCAHARVCVYWAVKTS